MTTANVGGAMSNLHDHLLRIGVTSGSRETDRVLECWGCRHFLRLAGAAGADWGVCAHPKGTADEPGSPNAGRLVFEHAGCGVWEEQSEEPEDDPLWHPVTPFSPPEFRTVYLYRAGDLDPAVGFRVEDGCETVWYHAEAGAECDDIHENRLIGHSAWKPTHYREIEADLPGRSESINKMAEHVQKILVNAVREVKALNDGLSEKEEKSP